MRDERELDRWAEEQAIGEAIHEYVCAILAHYGCEEPWQLASTLYKETDAGVWVMVRKHDGEWYKCDKDVVLDSIQAFSIGAIVEGSDAEVEGDEVDLVKLAQEYVDVDMVVSIFDEQVAYVDRAAQRVWDQLNEERKYGGGDWVMY